MNEYDCVCVYSGGLDSATMLADSVERYGADRILALSFCYGQRHKKELNYASNLCAEYGIDWKEIDITSINQLLPGSALTDDVDVPEGHYAEDTMKSTVVPNRNAIMANIAIGAVVAYGAVVLRLGVHAGDHPVYPDCRPEFIAQLESLAKVANEGFIKNTFYIDCPWLYVEKSDIAARAVDLGLEFDMTWSCYKGGEHHCGRCSTCVERLDAIDLAGYTSIDTTRYEDDQYWKEVIANANN